MSLNHIDIMGRLTRDPDLRYTQNQTPVASFSLAVDRDFKGSDGSREADFIPVVCWRQLAEHMQRWFRKGSMVVVSGRLQLRDYTDKEGTKRTVAEVVADRIYFGESKKDRDEANYAAAEREGKNYQPAAAPVSVEADEDGELPF